MPQGNVRGSCVRVPTEQTIALAQLKLRAQVWGDPAAPPLLALHGWLDNAASFALLAPRLATSHRVIALELPGHGHSDHPAAGSGFHYVDHVQAVLEAADVLQLVRYTLLGHSLGAGIASLVAAAAPERIERLLLIEGLGPLGDDGSNTLSRFRAALTPRTESRRPLRVFRSMEEAISARCLVSGMPPGQARPIVERGLMEADGGWRWRSDPRLTQPSAVRLAETQVHALLRGIEAPTALLLSSPATSYLPSVPMQARAACVANITVQHMDGGHHLHLEYPAAVADWARSTAQEPVGYRRSVPLPRSEITTSHRNTTMPLSMYQASVPVFVRALNNLAHVLNKGAEHAKSKSVSDEVLLQTRLITDMLPLIKQVQIACDMATRGSARLAGVEPQAFEDNETTLEQAHARITRAIGYIEGFKPAQIDGSEARAILLKMRAGELNFEGQSYLLNFVLPNLFFHCTTAYNILRKAGTDLGKTDFIGNP